MRGNTGYLLTGATGNVGHQTVRTLLESGAVVRAAVRHPERLADRIGEAIGRLETRCFDFDGSPPGETLFEGIGGILLVRPPQIRDVESRMFPFLRAARHAGVTRIVFLSLLGAQWLPFVPHRKLGKEIRRLGFDYTRPTPRAFQARAAEASWDREYITVVSRLFLTVRLGMARKVTGDLEELLRRPPRRLEEYVAERKELWQPAHPLVSRNSACRKHDTR